MSVPTWTPGPWRTEIDNVFAGPIDNSTYVADCAPMGGPIEGRPDQIANANLIAAAPDLYEVVDLLAGFAETASTLDWNEDRNVTWAAVVAAKARAALSKARGQS